MKKIIVNVTCMIVVFSCVFFIGCSKKEETHQPTKQNTVKYEETQQSTKQNIENQAEMETTVLTKNFYQMYMESIADIDIEVVKEAAYDYYNDLTFIEEIVDIRICTIEAEIKAFTEEDDVLGEVVVLEVDTITYGMEETDKRFMTLKKDNTGKWKVDNEGR